MDRFNDNRCLSRLIEALTAGDCGRAVGEIHDLLERGVDRETIIVHGIEKALELLDAKCTVEEFNLLAVNPVQRGTGSACSCRRPSLRRTWGDGWPHATLQVVLNSG